MNRYAIRHQASASLQESDTGYVKLSSRSVLDVDNEGTIWLIWCMKWLIVASN